MMLVPGRATASPDGRWLVGPWRSGPLQLFTIDGTHVREVTVLGGFWGWLPDSSGMFIANMVPQRAPPLAIMELDGRVVTTDLQLSHQALSRDGKLIVAEHQEGCCHSITQREIRVARRDGGGTRSLVLSQDPADSVALLGIDASNRAVYRDGMKIMRIPLAGGATTTLATSPDYRPVVQGNTSPDGAAILAHVYEPARWYIIANDCITAWNDAVSSVVEDGSSAVAKEGHTVVWVGPHVFLAKDQSGSLFTVDAVTSTRVPQAGRLVRGDVVLAHQSGTLLVARDGVVVLLELRSGALRDTGLDLRPDAGGAHVATLPTGGFLLSSSAGTYRID
jgi:hypothetical protein